MASPPGKFSHTLWGTRSGHLWVFKPVLGQAAKETQGLHTWPSLLLGPRVVTRLMKREGLPGLPFSEGPLENGQSWLPSEDLVGFKHRKTVPHLLPQPYIPMSCRLCSRFLTLPATGSCPMCSRDGTRERAL